MLPQSMPSTKLPAIKFMKTIKQVDGDEIVVYVPHTQPEPRPRYRDTLKELAIDIGGELAGDVAKSAKAIGRGLFQVSQFVAKPKPEFKSRERYHPKQEYSLFTKTQPLKPKAQSPKPSPCNCCCHCCQNSCHNK